MNSWSHSTKCRYSADFYTGPSHLGSLNIKGKNSLRVLYVQE